MQLIFLELTAVCLESLQCILDVNEKRRKKKKKMRMRMGKRKRKEKCFFSRQTPRGTYRLAILLESYFRYLFPSTFSFFQSPRKKR